MFNKLKTFHLFRQSTLAPPIFTYAFFPLQNSDLQGYHWKFELHWHKLICWHFKYIHFLHSLVHTLQFHVKENAFQIPKNQFSLIWLKLLMVPLQSWDPKEKSIKYPPTKVNIEWAKTHSLKISYSLKFSTKIEKIKNLHKIGPNLLNIHFL